jgi:hypothetical protein
MNISQTMETMSMCMCRRKLTGSCDHSLLPV